MTAPIRLRLTAWYFGVMLLALSLYGAAMYLAVRMAIGQAAEHDLHLRLAGAEEFLRRHVPQSPPDRLRREIREHAGMRPGGELLQVGTDTGELLFQSEAMRQLGISLDQWRSVGPPSGATLSIRGTPVKLLTEWIVVDGRRYGLQVAEPMAQSFTVLRRFGWLLLGSIPALVILASIGGYAISGRALSPIHRITEDARSITADRLSKRLEVPRSHDEVRSLSLTLNAMIDRLEQAFLKIRHFTADASHELRTPVSLIRSTAEFALMAKRDEDTYRAALRDNLEEAERMTLLIEDMLTLARADSDEPALPLSETDLAGPLEEAFHQAMPFGAANRIQMRLELAGEPMKVRGDAAALRRLFLILIDNGVKYTLPGGWLSVTGKRCAAEIVVQVSDSGIGISAEDLPNIFERFYRADKAHSHKSGAGLGLSIASCIVESHGAKIHVESEPGRGSAFTIRFKSALTVKEAVVDGLDSLRSHNRE